MINVQNVSKTFILHQQNGVRLPVLQRASLTVNAGECVVLHGHSGSGKSTLLRSPHAGRSQIAKPSPQCAARDTLPSPATMTPRTPTLPNPTSLAA